MDESSILKELADAVVACDPPRAKKAAEAALSAGMDPVKAINEASRDAFFHFLSSAKKSFSLGFPN